MRQSKSELLCVLPIPLQSNGAVVTEQAHLRSRLAAVCARHDNACSHAEGGDKRTVRSKEYILALEDRTKLLEERVRLLEALLDGTDRRESGTTPRPSRSSSAADDVSNGPIAGGSKVRSRSLQILTLGAEVASSG